MNHRDKTGLPTVRILSETRARADQWRDAALVFVAAVFNPFLCFVQTKGLRSIGSSSAIAIELVILGAAAFAVRSCIRTPMIVATAVTTGCLAFIWLINPDFDPKVMPDLAIIFLFFLLGNNANPTLADRIVKILIIVVLIDGIYELLFLESYVSNFDIYNYYVSKGMIESNATNYANTQLFVSGLRPEGIGRTILPGLFDAHRVSSIFLEPVSIGNFVTICWAWLLMRFWVAPVTNTLFLFLTATVMAFADSRFALLSCVALTIARFVPLVTARLAILAMPIVIVAGLVVAGVLNENPGSDDLAGRLIGTGTILASWNWGQWFAVEPSAIGILDAGYAYVINNLGLPICVGLWAVFAAPQLDSQSARLFRAATAIYLATGLCIGESVLSIKTAALLWFLYGAIQRPDVVQQPLISKRRGKTSAQAQAILVTALLLIGSALGATPALSRPFDTVQGVNLSGAEFGAAAIPGRYGWDYLYPNAGEVAYFARKGANLVRLPIVWERLQPTLGGPFDTAEQARLSALITAATNARVSLIVDIHNYGGYRGTLVGEPGLPATAFADLWRRLATLYGPNGRVIFGLMNEPKQGSADTWRQAVDAAIAAIRITGAKNLMLVPGIGWTGAHSFVALNAKALSGISDPANNYAFELHEYFDVDSSGTHPQCVPTHAAVARFQAVTQWLRDTKHRAVLGEFGASSEPQCLNDLRATLTFLKENADVWQGWTYWAAGPLWGEYMFSVEPRKDGTNRPQMVVLQSFWRPSKP